MMQEQARRAMDEADLIVRVRDCTDRQPHLDLPRTPDLCVAAKSDLNGSAHPDELLVSAITGQNMNELRRRLDLLAFGQAAPASLLALNVRHIQGIEAAREALARIQRSATAGAEVLALELREAMDALGSILGIVTPDDVLGRIFSTFCIGK
jgi:tRNA modification GTPase